METDVAAFARQLRQDGIDAARAEAERILAEARERAAQIEGRARAAAEAAERESGARIERLRLQHAAELRLAVRDAMLKVRRDVERLVVRLLQARIGDALVTEEVIRTAVVELIRDPSPGQEWEIRVGGRVGRPLVQAVVDDLFKGRDAVVTVVEGLGRTGLEFRTRDGAEVLELTEESVAAAFRQLLSPELAKFLDTLSL